MAREETRIRLLEAGAELVHLQGFNHTGIQEILRAAGIPRGSFYFHFDSKEQFGLELVDRYAGWYRRALEEIGAEEGDDPLDSLRMFFDHFLDYFERHGYTRGCPMGNLAQEMGDLSPAFRKKLRKGMKAIADPIRDLLARARTAGRLRAELDPEETALFLVSSWQGALLRMKVEKSPEPYRLFRKFVFEQLLA